MRLRCFICLGLVLSCLSGASRLLAVDRQAEPAIRVYDSTLVVPTYEHTGREMEPPLFASSTLTGLYPFPTYLPAFREGDPHPKTYRTIVVENEFLKLTYIPEMGGRFFSLYDKVRKKEVFYRNDVIKPTMFNPRLDWPQSGIELTGPYDAHMLTLHGEPFWSNTIIHHPDGSVSLMLGESDPMYHMNVSLTATLYPGIAAMQISVFCYNRNDGQMPQMFWTNASFPSTEKTRYIYPMTRTVGHTTGEVSDWPLYNGIDYSWDRNNQHMLGVFGIDAYDNFAGAYQFDHDFGVFRYADRRVVQGMKMWTFGYGPGAEKVQQQYTDHAGPYVEVQSGRHVWDGHYEWIAPHKVEMWSEWWIPVGGIGGVTSMSRDVALKLDVKPGSAGEAGKVDVALSATRVLPKATLTVTARSGELLRTVVDLAPGAPVAKEVAGIKSDADGLNDLRVRVVDAQGSEVLNYLRPDENPGRKQYSVFARSLEKPQVAPDQMTVEELVEAAEFKLKETNPSAMQELVAMALKKDPGDSRAHLLLGIYDYTGGKYKDAESELLQATDRDPYLDEAWYYLAASQLALGDNEKAERNLYVISPQSAYDGNREFLLGKLAFLRGQFPAAAEHLQHSTMANGYDLNARALLAMTLRQQGKKPEALAQLAELLRIDPTNRLVYAERFFLDKDAPAKQELLRLMGDQSQEAIDVATFYADAHRWHEATDVLKLVDGKNGDPWGTSPLFYYTLAYYQKRAGDDSAVSGSLAKARAASRIVDRFPYRRESEAPLAEAVQEDPKDTVARFNLGCLLYSLDRPDEAIAQWQAAIAVAPGDFSTRRALGLAYAEQGKTNLAAEELEKAVELKPAEPRTLNDLSSLYARTGRFDDQISLLQKALRRSPNDDDLEMALLNAYLIKGRYQDADQIVSTYQFAPRHRSTVLRDEYRNLRYGMGAVAFNKGDYPEALKLFQSVLKPPVSLGVDDFQFESTPRAYYYIGRTLEAEGRKEEANKAYQEAIRGIDLLSGDRDSWNTENFYAVLSLERLGNKNKAEDLIPHFDGFARTEMDSTNPAHRGQARYLLGLIAKNAGQDAQARKLMSQSLQALPDSLPPRYELRGDVIDPFPAGRTN
jgi:tetratricopeptide (TPR) repeat protein